jgi:hypothetical protein
MSRTSTAWRAALRRRANPARRTPMLPAARNRAKPRSTFSACACLMLRSANAGGERCSSVSETAPARRPPLAARAEFAAMTTALLVASTGGHLADLVELAQRMIGLGDRLWVTFDDEHGRTLLEGENKVLIPIS